MRSTQPAAFPDWAQRSGRVDAISTAQMSFQFAGQPQAGPSVRRAASRPRLGSYAFIHDRA